MDIQELQELFKVDAGLVNIEELIGKSSQKEKKEYSSDVFLLDNTEFSCLVVDELLKSMSRKEIFDHAWQTGALEEYVGGCMNGYDADLICYIDARNFEKVLDVIITEGCVDCVENMVQSLFNRDSDVLADKNVMLKIISIDPLHCQYVNEKLFTDRDIICNPNVINILDNMPDDDWEEKDFYKVGKVELEKFRKQDREDELKQKLAHLDKLQEQYGSTKQQIRIKRKV